MNRVVVTGMGMVSPLGCGISHNWSSIINGVSGIRKISLFDPEHYKCKVAAEVPLGDGTSGTFNAEQWIPKKDIKKYDEFIQFTLAACEQAFVQSGLLIDNKEIAERSGCIIGSGIGGLPGIEKNVLDFHSKKSKVSPFFITGRLINMAAGFASIKYNLQAANYSTVSACASGAHAIGESVRLIQRGEADVMVTGGTEATICPIGIEGFTSCRALSTKFNDYPEQASRPFDDDRDGFVMGEGAGILILEELEFAKKRNANILCELVGYGTSADAFHYTLPEPTGDGAYRAMKNALNDAKLNVNEISYINAHGTSTPAGDQVEITAVDKLFSNSENNVPMSSTKSQIGHLLGAAGAVEAIYSICSLNENLMPFNKNLENPCAHKKIDLIKNNPRELQLKYVLSNSFGFGGTNVSLIFSKYNL